LLAAENSPLQLARLDACHGLAGGFMTLQFADAADGFFASAVQSRVHDATGTEEHASTSRFRDRAVYAFCHRHMSNKDFIIFIDVRTLRMAHRRVFEGVNPLLTPDSRHCGCHLTAITSRLGGTRADIDWRAQVRYTGVHMPPSRR
jgi:hypothetical protein